MLELCDVKRAPSPSLHIRSEPCAQFAHAFGKAAGEQLIPLRLRIRPEAFRIGALQRSNHLGEEELAAQKLSCLVRHNELYEICHQPLAPHLIERGCG